jgi:hypothetical protein
MPDDVLHFLTRLEALTGLTDPTAVELLGLARAWGRTVTSLITDAVLGS